MLEAPRLTTMLRTFMTEKGQDFNASSEFASRQQRLRELKRTDPNFYKQFGASNDSKAATNNVRFDWKTFSASKDPHTRRAAIMKETFNKLYHTVFKALGADVSSEIVEGYVKRVFDVVSTSFDKQDRTNFRVQDPVMRKKVVTSLDLASLDNQGYESIVNSCVELHEWRSNKHDTSNSASSLNDDEESTPTVITREKDEFGTDISFSYPGGEWLKIGEPEKKKKEKVAEPKEVKPVVAKSSNAGYSVGGLDFNWLRTMCATHASVSSGMSSDALASSLHTILLSSKTDDELQEELFFLLGDSFELMTELLKNRKTYVKNAKSQPQPNLSSPAPPHTSFSQPNQTRSGISPSVTITLEEDKINEKRRRKEEKKLRKKGVLAAYDQGNSWTEGDISQLRRFHEEQLRQGPRDVEMLFDGDSSDFAGQTGRFVPGKVKMMLPEGTTRITSTLCEEVSVPYELPPPMSANETLKPITELDSWAQVAFRGFKSLNRIQSRLFEAAYKTNENLLVCAPTGAGKTNIALLTILHEIGQHFIGSVLTKDDFKIVYVAPMKALAAEMVGNFSKRLSPLGIVVRELTGDMQLTKKELNETQIIVTTPEKWDVVTRKSTDVALTQMVRLLIIDEVHLLHEDRGPVIETLIARTIRQVEATQTMIRLVGLSATLPNYQDVALFLRVDPARGLFYFDNSYRPVPLTQNFIGVKETNPLVRLENMNTICYDKLKQSRKQGHQAMIFVHARKDTVKTAEKMAEYAEKENCSLFEYNIDPIRFESAKREVAKSRNKELRLLFEKGFGIHHAGMLRSDRNLVEKLFAEGLINVLVCTATLAWGVNLPAHTVIIKGTQIYDAKHGTFIELSMLDVMQIFGRAGRPQFDTSGEGFIITTIEQLPRYLSLLNQQLPIESQFEANLADNLNAEIILGTVTNVKEAIQWLSYTYLFIRMRRNPLVYGITYEDSRLDPMLEQKRRELVVKAARVLHECQMISFDERSGNFHPTDIGRIASHFYIQHDTIQHLNENLHGNAKEEDLCNIFAQASEFENIRLRDEEMEELHQLEESACAYPVKGGPENTHGKVNILLQAYLSQAQIDNFSLVSDSAYISSNAPRLFRAMFEFALKKGWPLAASHLLTLCKMVDRRIWSDYHPLRQFPNISPILLTKLEEAECGIDKLIDMQPNEIGSLLNHPKAGFIIKKYVDQFPKLELSASIQPITRTVLRVHLTITPSFTWKDNLHGSVEPWWIWVEDNENEHIYHSEYFLLNKKQKDEPQELIFTIPVFEPLPPQYYIRVISEKWLGAEAELALSFKHLILPELHIPHTELLNLEPLPVSALHDPKFEKIYPFSHFNPIQTQVFHTLVHTDHNVLLGAPTGSGKTITAELAMFRLFNNYPNLKVVYIAPLKALVKERMRDWNKKFVQTLGKNMVELTGDVTPDIKALKSAHIVTTTPEKWDGISRCWQQRSYVRKVGLLIIDEIHLLGEERGPILEVIVSRMRYISSHTEMPIRVVGLSTALANAKDLADWLGIDGPGLFNFRPSVRPVPLEAHITGFSGKHYCPRMATMNKPTYASIIQYSPDKPVLVFVSSRRQTRLTAFDLISYCVGDENPRRFLHMSDHELTSILSKVSDANLKHALSFGIGLHHAGLAASDRDLVEELFAQVKIQILVSTSTLAWGVNLPAHLVVIKGTEFYDGKTKRYVDMPITDILQMMGRAGRPQFDNHAVACIFVHEPKKNFYKKFLYEPFPVESSLHKCLHDHINAEIVAGTIKTKQDAIDYLTWTYLFRRLVVNPSYYGLEDSSFEAISQYLSELVDNILQDLQTAGCIIIDEESIDFLKDETGLAQLVPQTFGRISSFYYLHFKTMRLFAEYVKEDNTIESLLAILCNTAEYEELPVRHNEEKINAELASQVPWAVDSRLLDNPHVKANLLLQAHFSRLELPVSDYITDTKSVLDQAVRILQAMVDVAADEGFLFTTLNTMHLMQTIIQGRWFTDSTLSVLPLGSETINELHQRGIESMAELIELDRQTLSALLPAASSKKVISVVSRFPIINVDIKAPSQCSIKEEECTIEVKLTRVNNPSTVYAPAFPKTIDESWWLVLGDPETGELIGLKRLTFAKTLTTSLSLTTPATKGKRDYSLYLMSACYLGIDQQYTLSVDFCG